MIKKHSVTATWFGLGAAILMLCPTAFAQTTSADLALSEISSPSETFARGDQVIIGTEVDNVGGTTSPAYSVTYYASVNQQINASDTALGSVNRNAVGAGNSDNFNANLVLPGNLADGNYFIGGIINLDDANLGNNVNADDEPLTVSGGGGVGGNSLNPGHNGNWWGGPAFNGEGVQVEVANDGLGGLVFVATIYSYGPMGGQIFLIAVGPVTNDVAIVDVFITEGGMWGNVFDPSLVTETQWGTGLFTSGGCDLLSMILSPNAEQQAMGYTVKTNDLGRLTMPAAPCPTP